MLSLSLYEAPWQCSDPSQATTATTVIRASVDHCRLFSISVSSGVGFFPSVALLRLSLLRSAHTCRLRPAQQMPVEYRGQICLAFHLVSPPWLVPNFCYVLKKKKNPLHASSLFLVSVDGEAHVCAEVGGDLSGAGTLVSHVGPGTELRSSGLAASVFTH